jgi:D-lactate dehydrogenase
LPADCTTGYSSSRTCEIGLSEHAGIPYRSIIRLVDDCARPLSRTLRQDVVTSPLVDAVRS